MEEFGCSREKKHISSTTQNTINTKTQSTQDGVRTKTARDGAVVREPIYTRGKVARLKYIYICIRTNNRRLQIIIDIIRSFRCTVQCRLDRFFRAAFCGMKAFIRF